MGVEGFYVMIVMIISAPIALFERWGIARYKVGWGEPLPQNTIWGKQVGSLPGVGDVLLTRYHFTMFLVIVPGGVILLTWLGNGLIAHPFASWWAWVPFVVAGVLGVMMTEDFLFFVFNTLWGAPYPHALARLFRGEATWHTNVSLGFCKVPAFYLAFPMLIAILLKFAQWIG